jgi:hypothetical protein
MADDSLSADEIRELRTMLEIEKVKKVKLLYSQLMDARDIDGLIQIVSDDAVCEYGPYGVWRGRQEILDGWTAVFKDSQPYSGFHVTTNHWVEMTSPTTAKCRSYLVDIVHEPDPRTDPVIWYGIYDEDYVKIDGHWKVSFCRLEFLWPKRLVSAEFPRAMVPRDLM